MWILLIVIGTSTWVYFDAKSIGVKKSGEKAPVKTGSVQADMGPVGWAICCLLLWIIAFPLYLFKRPGLKKRFQQPASAPAPPIPPPTTAGSQPQDFDQPLRRLAKLKEDGIVTAEEFEQKKKALLGL
jgi:hypothetical protein